ncbi:UNVERIFIED_CONTAM: hypothetical protein Sradi_5751900 [Sesamum radiatum]|uniref:Retrotransposon gag domain-containing protein n=1 Tax=Sesamum radiatum TaxID=300843 RepID=A0AAW2L6Q5_SESRA
MEITGVVEIPMMEYSFPTADGTISSIAKPVVQANNFEIKPAIIQIIWSSVQFSDWLQSLPAGSITTWTALTQKFLAKYFPPAKTAKMLNDITSFVQLDRESLYDAWERFKSVTIMKKLPSEAFNIIDEIATNLYSYGQDRADKRTADIHSIDAVLALFAQMTALTHKVDNLRAANVEWCTNRTLWCMWSNGILESKL